MGGRKVVFVVIGLWLDEELCGMLKEFIEIYEVGRFKMVIDC